MVGALSHLPDAGSVAAVVKELVENSLDSGASKITVQVVDAGRTLLKIVGAKRNARVNLKIYEPEGSRRFRAPQSEEGSSTPAASSEASVDDLGI